MAILWRCPYCSGLVPASKGVCPQCGKDSTRHKDKTFYADLRIKMADGVKRLRRKLNARNLEEAKLEEAQLKARLKTGSAEVFVKSELPFETYWREYYLPYCKSNNAPGTYRRKETMGRLWIVPFLKDYRLKDITLGTLQQFLEWRKAQGKRDNKGGEVSQNELRHLVAVLKHCFNYAVKLGFIQTNPAKHLSVKVEDTTDAWHILEEEEIERLLEHIPIPQRYLIAFLAHTGLRWSDASTLKWTQVDLLRKTITVKQEKTGKTLTIPLYSKAWQVLVEAQKFYSQFADYDPTGYVFVNLSTGKPYKDLHNVFKAALERAGLPKSIRIHDLRHSYALRCLRKGVSLAAVKELLGHKAIQTTMKYVHLTTRDLEEAVKLLDQEEPPLRLVEGGKA